ncbi:MAG: chemotaxis protein CheW [Thiothrix sp.]|nr:chemotaxis protein CheW [Thiothrix sp.]HPQ94211.1 chemotaxis protein CheW [Thiolinea sp.]
MSSPYELLAGLALLREKRRQQDRSEQSGLAARSVLVVTVAGRTCAISQDVIEEILAQDNLASVKEVEPWILGIGYFRGKLLNVVDAAMLFFGQEKDILSYQTARILVVQGEKEWFGLMVEELLGIRHVWSDRVDKSVSGARNDDWLGFSDQKIEIEGQILPVLQLKKLVCMLERHGKPVVDALS